VGRPTQKTQRSAPAKGTQPAEISARNGPPGRCARVRRAPTGGVTSSIKHVKPAHLVCRRLATASGWPTRRDTARGNNSAQRPSWAVCTCSARTHRRGDELQTICQAGPPGGLATRNNQRSAPAKGTQPAEISARNGPPGWCARVRRAPTGGVTSSIKHVKPAHLVCRRLATASGWPTKKGHSPR